MNRSNHQARPQHPSRPEQPQVPARPMFPNPPHPAERRQFPGHYGRMRHARHPDHPDRSAHARHPSHPRRPDHFAPARREPPSHRVLPGPRAAAPHATIGLSVPPRRRVARLVRAVRRSTRPASPGALNHPVPSAVRRVQDLPGRATALHPHTLREPGSPHGPAEAGLHRLLPGNRPRPPSGLGLRLQGGPPTPRRSFGLPGESGQTGGSVRLDRHGPWGLPDFRGRVDPATRQSFHFPRFPRFPAGLALLRASYVPFATALVEVLPIPSTSALDPSVRSTRRVPARRRRWIRPWPLTSPVQVAYLAALHGEGPSGIVWILVENSG